jgi:hypothetical protein
MEGPVEYFSGISRLELSGSVCVTIGEDGVIKTSDPRTDKLKKQGNALVIEGVGGGGNSIMTIGGVGGSMIFNNMSGKVIEFDDSADVIKVNGAVLGEEQDKRARKNAAPEPPPLTKYVLRDSAVQSITIKGSSTLESIHYAWLAEALSVQVTGSGDANIPAGKVFATLTAVVTGSGDITGSGTRVTVGTFTVAGSGDISGFVVERTGSCSIAGSGDIKVTKGAGANITKSVAGSGSVRIK